MKKRWQILFILFVATLAYLPIFANGFAIDDPVFVGKYHPSIIEAFKGAVPLGHEGVYRPVRGILYALYYNVFGTNLFFYHLHSLLVHLAATVLVYLIIFNLQFSVFNQSSVFNENWKLPALSFEGEIENSNWLPFLASLLFGLHPIHTESITYIAASMEMTGVVFMLTSFWLYLKASSKLSIIMALLAFFTYEMTLTLPLLLVLYEGVLGLAKPDPAPRERWGEKMRAIGVIGAIGVMYLVVRFSLGVGSRGPYLANSVYLTAITMPRVMVKYLFLLVWPANLANNHIIAPGIEAFVYRGYRTAAIASQSILDPEILMSITIIMIIIVITIIQRKKYPLVSFGIGWFFISLLPGLEIIPQGSMMNEKLLYIPSVGLVTVLAYGIFNLQFTIFNKFSIYKFTIIVVLLIALFYGVRTAVRNMDWRDDVTLWQKDVAMYPTESAYARFALGNAYNSHKDYQKAIEQYQKSVEINPGFAVGYASLSRTYRDLGNTELSNFTYQMAQKAEPGFWTRQ